jgi:hypothetical protein
MPKPIAIIPAQPGWLLLEPCYNHGQIIDFRRTPIIAWAVNWEEEVEGDEIILNPITVEGAQSTYALVRTPDGQILAPYLGRWDSEDTALEYVRQNRISAASAKDPEKKRTKQNSVPNKQGYNGSEEIS